MALILSVNRMNYWLLKSEESCYSIDDLMRDKTTRWSGVRNYQARNFMRDMKMGDMCLFYHSSSKPTGVVGVCTVVETATADETALDPSDDHFDLKSTPEKPIWECVTVKYVKHLKNIVTLTDIKLDSNLSGIMLAQQGSRLSIQPVSEKHFKYITKTLGETKV